MSVVVVIVVAVVIVVWNESCAVFIVAMQARAGGLGLVGDVQAALQAHRRCAGVQEAALQALICLTSASDANAATAAELGVLDEVEAAMAAHPDAPPVLEAACGALRSLVGAAAAAADGALPPGLIAEVEAAMKRHPSSGRLQYNGQLALHALQEQPSHR